MILLESIVVWCLDSVNAVVWGVPTLALILGTGAYLTFRTGAVQIRLFPRMLMQFHRKLRQKTKHTGVSSFQALCTALAATVGTGNIVGVAGAIALGGPGAIFWMWVCAFFGMAVKYAEATLAVRYRSRAGGEFVGGPMYIIRNALGKKWTWLGSVYSFFGVAAAFGVGNATQINAVITAADQVVQSFGGRESKLRNFALGILLALILGAVLLGGAKHIGRATELLVPFAALGYMALCVGVLVLRCSAIPAAFGAILRGAISPQAVTGGVIGSVLQTLRIGVSRGVFTNEAGMGTAGIAHASAAVDHPVEQGMMGILEVFLDTVVLCTMTALVILCSGVPVSFGTDPGGMLTGQAFATVYGDWVSVFLALALCCFAFATVLGWGLYGIRCAEFLFGSSSRKIFPWLQTLMVVLASVMNTGVIWTLAETVNGLMAVPNLITLVCLSTELKRLTHEYTH